MSINKNGQPQTSEPIVFESTNGKKPLFNTTVIYCSKSATLRYLEQTKGLCNIEPIPGSKGSRRGGIRNIKGDSTS